MSGVDVTRIAGNIGALNALNSLQNINAQLATHQARLATGKRITEAADDPAGMSLATTFDVRRSNLKTVLTAIGDGKNLLSTAEGGLTKIQDILVKMKNKALEATSGTIGSAERNAIQQQLSSFSDEIDAIVDQTQWNGTDLIGKSGSSGSAAAATTMSFLTDVNGSNTTLSLGQGYAANGTGTTGLGIKSNSTTMGITVNGTTTLRTTALTTLDTAINTVKAGIANVGAFSARLTFKEEALTVQYTNTEAAYNRIMNANMAEEQVEASKLLILQQTATAMLSQANTAPQFLLSLFR